MTTRRIVIDEKLFEKYREVNVRKMTNDRLRCQYCQGFYWRVWIDQIQCIGCQYYTMIEVGEEPMKKQLEFPFMFMTQEPLANDTLLTVKWIRAQLRGPNGIEVHRRIKDPISGRSEFVVFKDRLRCRVTGSEVQLVPRIKRYWIVKSLPSAWEQRMITAEEAFELVKKNLIEQPVPTEN